MKYETKKIKWEYNHHLNNRSVVRLVKEGEYFGRVKHTYRHWEKFDARQMAVVKFEGNKRISFVPFEELQFT